MCDEIIDAEAKSNNEEIKSVPIHFNEKNITCKTQNFYILLAFLLIAIALLIADMIKSKGFDLDNILIDEKSYGNILV